MQHDISMANLATYGNGVNRLGESEAKCTQSPQGTSCKSLRSIRSPCGKVGESIMLSACSGRFGSTAADAVASAIDMRVCRLSSRLSPIVKPLPTALLSKLTKDPKDKGTIAAPLHPDHAYFFD